ncbi:hypothetical protein BDN71DRAFT_1435928 [Pleurotus eryngii]|uniref:Uncharacterized protein n=1 Tax=Pleurotus eryngii TaxID=5323 RepID=A0A9P5ZJ51_PLEER|nr:hypothetical protein BDN71DRAFT_1435928 [Pleurotus eryngii]
MFHTFFCEQHKGEKQSGRQSGFRPYICTPGAGCSGNANSGSRLSVPSSTEMMDDAERLMSEEVTDAEGVRLRQPWVRCYKRKDFAFVEIDLLGISAGDITLSLQDNRLTLFALNDLRRIAYEWEIYIYISNDHNKSNCSQLPMRYETFCIGYILAELGEWRRHVPPTNTVPQDW